ncbi:hypothetical protein ACO2J1_04200 [Leptospira interrogans]|uniref:Uncharacterized protein n=1 Tax=Leptospira interrogans serovar Pomona TaxID=44276 RepID=A0AA41BI98_LEPIR|nr:MULTISPECIES: hypothetical protein [Leptospira]ASV06933.1 hypothetical protein B2G47_14825 [Leptospira interrogans serovar Canicola]ASV08606.1 hypothetical protein B2G50_05720 [Leptospira interrogans serovar Canicola]EJO77160.1 hypothetical protein LEP1GSC045_0921 [Leptospira interrogans serovar Pomona str. Kennewicki LC82-25]EMF32370.1 hypothetical protein LEP1GSC201_4201 [Leptospira interrogans serovar Pomona str. Fox 32256]KGE23307.1 hypothetical protein IQ65_19245 [Leptospira interrogan
MFFTSFMIAILGNFNFLLELSQNLTIHNFILCMSFPHYRISDQFFRKRFKVTSIFICYKIG